MTLPQLQAAVKEMCALNCWDNDSVEQKFLLFAEEVGELAKAIRHRKGLYNEEGKPKYELAEEFADVQSYLANLANMLNVDLEQAIIEKDKVNQKREWKV